MRNRLITPFILITLATLLTACGSSDDSNEEYPSAYLQFYNGSANSALTVLRDEEDSVVLGYASYGDTTSLLTLDGGDMEIEFYRTDSDDLEVTIANETVNLADGEKTLLVMTGNFSSPSFNAYNFYREDLEDHFRLFAMSVNADGSSYDLYMSEAGAPFESANMLGTITYEGFEELTYWDGDSDSNDFDIGDYTLYLTEPGSTEVIFESPTIPFSFATEYVLAIRTSSGAIQNGTEVDLIINSSVVVNYDDVEASSQFRLYNSVDGENSVNITFEGNQGVEESFSLEANTLSDFTPIDFGDYRLSANVEGQNGTGFNNRLVTLNQGESKAIVLYENEEGDLTSMSFEESNVPQVFDKNIQVANLVSDFDNLDLYFVRKDETIESAQYYVSSVDFGESKSVTLPSDYYELVVVYDGSEDTLVLLDRTELIEIVDEQNFIITIEHSETTATGYKVSLLY